MAGGAAAGQRLRAGASGEASVVTHQLRAWPSESFVRGRDSPESCCWLVWTVVCFTLFVVLSALVKAPCWGRQDPRGACQGSAPQRAQVCSPGWDRPVWPSCSRLSPVSPPGSPFASLAAGRAALPFLRERLGGGGVPRASHLRRSQPSACGCLGEAMSRALAAGGRLLVRAELQQQRSQRAGTVSGLRSGSVRPSGLRLSAGCPAELSGCLGGGRRGLARLCAPGAGGG